MKAFRCFRRRPAVFVFIFFIVSFIMYYCNVASLWRMVPKEYVSDFYLRYVRKNIHNTEKMKHIQDHMSTRLLHSTFLLNESLQSSTLLTTSIEITKEFSKSTLVPGITKEFSKSTLVPGITKEFSKSTLAPKESERKFGTKYWCEFLEKVYPLALNFTALLVTENPDLTSVKPIHDHPFHFIFNASSACASRDKIKIICVVKSAFYNFELREVIRKTWAKDAKENGSVVIFSLGYSENHDIQEKIREEYRKYMDIIQEEFSDSYYNNTLKTVMGIRWISRFCQKADYVLMVDDDIIVNYRNLERYFETVNPDHRNALYSGHLKSTDVPMRNPKGWYVPEDVYPYSCYPPYLSGGALLTSIEVIKKMNIAMPYVKRFKFDDVYLGILLQKLGIMPQKNPYVYLKMAEYKNNTNDFIAIHGFKDPKEYFEIYQSIVSK